MVTRNEVFSAMASEEHAVLARRATELKRKGDINGAVAALQRRKKLLGEDYSDTRLAKFLQAAGRVDEALTEIQWLLDDSARWARQLFSHQPASVMLRQKTGHMARVHKDAALICKRAGRPDLQAHHTERYDTLMALVWRLDPVCDADQTARRREWEEARAKGGAVYRAFLQARAGQ